MKREFSAGGIVYQKSIRQGPDKNQKSKIVWLVVQHSGHKGWVFPKGLIEKVQSAKCKVQNLREKENKESTEEAALREVREEGGIKAKILAEISAVSYWYVFREEKVFKTVYYFLMEYVRGDIKDHDFEVCASKWLDEEEVKKTLTYKSDKIAFANALKIFQEKRPQFIRKDDTDIA